jgi:predicted O-methyltransferase YrrM
VSDVPIIINCRDRLDPLVQLVDYLERAGHDRIYLLDNDSVYPPLLEYLDRSPHEVVRLGRNGGRLSLWELDLFGELGISGRFVFTDPDIVPDERCPLDAIEYFGEILDTYPEREKAGFGLRIDDLPDQYRFKQEVLTWESQFWERPIAPRLYDAPIDTTFALYHRPAPHRLDPALRTGFPYVARHTPWYLDDRSLPADEAFYRGRSEGEGVNNWGRETLVPTLAAAIAAREATAGSVPRMDFVEATAPSGNALLDVSALLEASGWVAEPEPQDETLNTPWADAGWHSWNDMSPEVEICDLLVSLAIASRPKRIVETGTGQGFLTRRIAAVLQGDQKLICFESDPTWRQALASLPFFDGERCVISPHDSPHAAELETADLTCFDSDFRHRLPEVKRWWQSASEGALLFAHDAGNRHGPDTPHASVRAKIIELAIPGFFLANPRGAFIGIKLSRHPHTASTAELRARLDAAEDELRALRATKTFRYSEAARRLYGRLTRGRGR